MSTKRSLSTGINYLVTVKLADFVKSLQIQAKRRYKCNSQLPKNSIRTKFFTEVRPNFKIACINEFALSILCTIIQLIASVLHRMPKFVQPELVVSGHGGMNSVII